jgi:hypothetical protein
MTIVKALQLGADGNHQEVGIETNPFTEVISERFVGSSHYVCAAGMTDLVIEGHDMAVFRAIQYSYTVANSDFSGYETGQICMIHDGANAVINWSQGAAIGVPSGIAFSSDVSGGQLRLRISTDNSGGGFSRILHLFTVALS